MTTDTDTAIVAEIPDCDVHLKLYDVRVPAAYDAETHLPGSPWAYMCADCFPRFGPGLLGLGDGQRLVLESAQPKES